MGSMTETESGREIEDRGVEIAAEARRTGLEAEASRPRPNLCLLAVSKPDYTGNIEMLFIHIIVAHTFFAHLPCLKLQSAMIFAVITL